MMTSKKKKYCQELWVAQNTHNVLVIVKIKTMKSNMTKNLLHQLLPGIIEIAKEILSYFNQRKKINMPALKTT